MQAAEKDRSSGTEARWLAVGNPLPARLLKIAPISIEIPESAFFCSRFRRTVSYAAIKPLKRSLFQTVPPTAFYRLQNG